MKLSEVLANMQSANLFFETGTVLDVPEDEFVMEQSCLIEGALIQGNGNNCIRISGSDITFRNVTFRHFYSAVVIDGYGREIRNIRFENCTFEDYGRHGILIGSSRSNSAIDTIVIDRCTFRGPGFRVSKKTTFGITV